MSNARIEKCARCVLAERPMISSRRDGVYTPRNTHSEITRQGARRIRRPKGAINLITTFISRRRRFWSPANSRISPVRFNKLSFHDTTLCVWAWFPGMFRAAVLHKRRRCPRKQWSARKTGYLLDLIPATSDPITPLSLCAHCRAT